MQVITVPDGWPIRASQVRPGREHDTTAVRVHTEILPALAAAAGDLRSLGDPGREGESQTITVAFKIPKHGKLTTMHRPELAGEVAGLARVTSISVRISVSGVRSSCEELATNRRWLANAASSRASIASKVSASSFSSSGGPASASR